MDATPARMTHRSLLGFAAAWTFLNVFLNIDAPAPNPPLHHLLLPSLEVWGVLLLLSLPPLNRLRFGPGVYLPVIGFLVFCRLFRVGDTLMPVYFNRPFNLYVDTGYVSGLIHLLYHSFSGLRLALFGAGGLAAAAIGLWGLHRALKTAHGFFASPPFRRGFWLFTAVQSFLVACYVGGGYPDRLSPPATSIAPRLLSELRFILDVGEIQRKGLAAVQMAETAIPAYSKPLAGLQGADVHLLLIESYGRTLFDDSRHAGRFGPTSRAFEAGLTRMGFGIASAYLGSPTFGGASWLAFSTLETGVWVPDQLRYHYLLSSRVRPLADHFKQAGYRTVSVMPGTTMPWPEGAFFAYETRYYAKDFDYRGPAFGWSPMPDQFALEVVRRREIARRHRPLFVRYVLTSSHAPFHEQPPYVEDWDRIGDGAIYNGLEAVRYPNNWPDLREAGDAYRRAIAYDLEVVQGFLGRCIGDRDLVLVLGDHQPNAHLTGDDPGREIPVHAISRSRELLDPFLDMGFTPGVVPEGSGAAPGMDAFMPAFLKAFSR